MLHKKCMKIYFSVSTHNQKIHCSNTDLLSFLVYTKIYREYIFSFKNIWLLLDRTDNSVHIS